MARPARNITRSRSGERPNLLRRENNLDVTRAHIEEVRTEQVLFALVADFHLRDGNKVLVLADVVRKALVAERVDFAGNDKAVGPDFN